MTWNSLTVTQLWPVLHEPSRFAILAWTRQKLTKKDLFVRNDTRRNTTNAMIEVWARLIEFALVW
jgi:hypothetical protein